MSVLLEVDRLNSYYGDSHILFDVSLHVNRNEVVALLGRNGAGKSTTLNSLMGMVRKTCAHTRLLSLDCSWCRRHAASLAV
jgi:branched-chain amino acid transport system ATP-binding protein